MTVNSVTIAVLSLVLTVVLITVWFASTLVYTAEDVISSAADVEPGTF